MRASRLSIPSFAIWLLAASSDAQTMPGQGASVTGKLLQNITGTVQ